MIVNRIESPMNNIRLFNTVSNLSTVLLLLTNGISFFVLIMKIKETRLK